MHSLGPLAGLVLLACGSTSATKTQATRSELCDGSDELRLQFVVLTDPSHALTNAMPFRNGAVYLRVDGTCRYWAYGVGLKDAGNPRATTPLDPIIGGRLSQLDAHELAEALQYDDWQSYDGKHTELTTAGLTSSVFTDGKHQFSCGLSCNAPGMPDTAHGLRDSALTWVVRLVDSGTGVSGPVRVGSYETGTSQPEWQAMGYECVALPGNSAASSFALAMDPAPVGTLVTAEAMELRALRDAYRASRFAAPLPVGTPSWAVNVAIPVCEAERVWSVLVSDVIEPFERDGAVPR